MFYDFYLWLSAIFDGFTLTKCNNTVKVALTLQAIPLNKKDLFNNITTWDTFKVKLSEEFGSINIFGKNVNQIFELLPRYVSIQEFSEELSPKMKTLHSQLRNYAAVPQLGGAPQRFHHSITDIKHHEKPLSGCEAVL